MSQDRCPPPCPRSRRAEPLAGLEPPPGRAPLAVFELDAAGRYLLCQGQPPDPSGGGPEMVIGQSFLDRCVDRPDLAEAVLAALAGRPSRLATTLGQRRLELTLVPRSRPGGASAGLIGVVHEPTADALPGTSDSLFGSLVTNMRGIIFCHGVRGQGAHGYDDLGAALYGADAQAIAGTVDDRGRARIGTWYDAVHPDDQPAYLEAERRRKEELVPYTLEYRITHPASGELRWMREVAWVVEEPAQGLISFDSYIHDITAPKRVELALRESEERHRRLLEAAPVGILSLADGACVYANPHAVRLLGGGSVRDLLGRRLDELVQGADAVRLARDLDVLLPRGQLPPRELAGLRIDGAQLDLEVSAVASPAAGTAAGTGEVQLVLADLAERKHAEMMRHLAEHDALTGLPNRRRLLEHLRRGIGATRRYGGGLALHLLDLDGFKRVNDRHGHAGGDEVLRQVAARIRHLVREEDLLARFGGDEFALVQGHVRDPEAMAALAQRVIETVARPFTLGRQQVRLGVSIGIACSADGAGSPEKLLEEADRALYRAKGEGRGRLRFFAPELDRAVELRRQLELDLARASDQGELGLVYQPQLALPSGRIVGAEALLRWHSPSRGLVSPTDFIPVAERAGLMAPIGAWVIDRACAQARAWRDAGIGLPVSVNVSAVQLRQPLFAQEVERSLQRHSLAPADLCLELTESLLIDPDLDDVGGLLRRLSAMGLRIAIDDFGTGYSSLTNLRRLPVDTIKIDRSFVGEVGGAGDSEAIINATVGLAHSLGKEVVAEGVETDDQHAFLLAAGCDQAQGYRYGRPDAPDRIGELVRATRAA